MNRLKSELKTFSKPHQRRYTDRKLEYGKMLHKICQQGNANYTTMKYHTTPRRMAKIQNKDNTKCWQGCGATGVLIYYW